MGPKQFAPVDGATCSACGAENEFPLNCASDLECKIAGLVSSAGRQEPLPLMPRHPGSGKRLPIDFADMLRSSMGELKAYAFAMPPR
jgi:hypothetical protein